MTARIKVKERGDGHLDLIDPAELDSRSIGMEDRSDRKAKPDPGCLSCREIRFTRDLDRQTKDVSLVECLDLFFQVITLAESFSKLVGNLSSVARDSTLNIRNLSLEFTAAFNGLRDFLNDLRSGKEDQPTMETNNLPNRETAIAYIVQCLRSHTYVNVIKYLRSAR